MVRPPPTPPSPSHTRFPDLYTLQPISLKHNVSLRAIHIRFFSRLNVDTHTHWVAQTLSAINSALVDHVSFGFDSTAIVLHPFLRWSVVDEIMGQPPFSNLKQVDILVSTPTTPEVLSRYMDCLPRCHARSILSVRTVEWELTDMQRLLLLNKHPIRHDMYTSPIAMETHTP